MNARAKVAPAQPIVRSAEERIGRYDWQALSTELSSYGCAVIDKLLTPDECREIAALYPHEEHFRSHIHMARHGFGRGEYRYFKYPLPDLLAGLRAAFYPHLASVANAWNERMGLDQRYPRIHADFLKLCCDAGQTRPTFPATSTACTRTFTAISRSRSRWRSCSRSPAGTSPAASSS
jgi:uncharacterized protein